MKVEVTICCCQKPGCGHTWIPKSNAKKDEKGNVFFKPTNKVIQEVKKCPKCHAWRWDIAEDGRTKASGFDVDSVSGL